MNNEPKTYTLEEMLELAGTVGRAVDRSRPVVDAIADWDAGAPAREELKQRAFAATVPPMPETQAPLPEITVFQPSTEVH